MGYEDRNNDHYELAYRIIADPVCVIEGSDDDIEHAFSIVSQFIMQEECRNKLDRPYLDQLNKARDVMMDRRMTMDKYKNRSEG
tara:strand:+ start:84 stop:335 length:252 start_codon:yes stop_codon:yes gene_type:complete